MIPQSINTSFQGSSRPVSLEGLNNVRELVEEVARIYDLENVKIVSKGGRLFNEESKNTLTEAGEFCL